MPVSESYLTNGLLGILKKFVSLIEIGTSDMEGLCSLSSFPFFPFPASLDLIRSEGLSAAVSDLDRLKEGILSRRDLWLFGDPSGDSPAAAVADLFRKMIGDRFFSTGDDLPRPATVLFLLVGESSILFLWDSLVILTVGFSLSFFFGGYAASSLSLSPSPMNDMLNLGKDGNDHFLSSGVSGLLVLSVSPKQQGQHAIQDRQVCSNVLSPFLKQLHHVGIYGDQYHVLWRSTYYEGVLWGYSRHQCYEAAVYFMESGWFEMGNEAPHVLLESNISSKFSREKRCLYLLLCTYSSAEASPSCFFSR